MQLNNQSGTFSLGDELKVKLAHGKTHFWFRKDNGEEREAWGTRNFNDIPEEDHPKGTGKTNPLVIPFYDLEKNAWRSCKANSVIAIESQREVRSTLI